MAEDEGVSLEEVCDQLLAELAAQEGDETALAELEFINFGDWGRAIENAAKEAARSGQKLSPEPPGSPGESWRASRTPQKSRTRSPSNR